MVTSSNTLYTRRCVYQCTRRPTAGRWTESRRPRREANRLQERELEEGGSWKLVAGTDCAIASWWYVDVQYLHGSPDESGQDALKDAELIAGALLHAGDADSKLGNRLTGPNAVFVEGRLYF